MIRLARSVLVTIGVLIAVIAGAVAAREIVMAADHDLQWSIPSWWHWVVAPGHEAYAGIAAAAAGVVASVCLWWAWRVLHTGGSTIRSIDIVAEGGTTVIEAGAIDRYLSRSLLRSAPEVKQARVWLYDNGEAYDALAVVTVSPCDLGELHARVLAAMGQDLGVATGRSVASLELEVDRFVLKEKGGT